MPRQRSADQGPTRSREAAKLNASYALTENSKLSIPPSPPERGRGVGGEGATQPQTRSLPRTICDANIPCPPTTVRSIVAFRSAKRATPDAHLSRSERRLWPAPGVNATCCPVLILLQWTNARHTQPHNPATAAIPQETCTAPVPPGSSRQGNATRIAAVCVSLCQ